MQRVPEIRIFGSSGHNWRPASSSSKSNANNFQNTSSSSFAFDYNKNHNTYNNNNNYQRQQLLSSSYSRAHLYQQQPVKQNTLGMTMKRSNSMSRITGNFLNNNNPNTNSYGNSASSFYINQLSDNNNSKLNKTSYIKKPFETDYYSNAIRICDNNRVLGNIKNHSTENVFFDFRSTPYIVKGCRLQKTRACRQCVQEQQKVTQKNNNIGTNYSHSVFSQTRRRAQQILRQNEQKIIMLEQQLEKMRVENNFNPESTNRQSQTNYMNDCEDPEGVYKLKSDRQNQKRQPIQFMTYNKTNQKPNKKIVSFQQIIESATNLPSLGQQQNQHQHTFRNIVGKQNQYQKAQPHFRQINTEKDFSLQENYNQANKKDTSKNIVIIESKCETFIDRNKQKNNQNPLLPEISCLINELHLIGSLGEAQEENTTFMLDQLKQAARADLQVRKNCINQLDDIINRYGQNSHMNFLGA